MPSLPNPTRRAKSAMFWKVCSMRHKWSLLLFVSVFTAWAQEDAGSSAVMKQVLERLDILERTE